MRLQTFIVDAFTDQSMTGNPAGVCPLDHWLPDAVMQSIASELNQSETVFFAPRPGAKDTSSYREYDMRWFTPTREVDMIGHATLAAGHILLSHLEPTLDEVCFFSATAKMTVCRGDHGLRLNMPALVPEVVDPPAGLTEALGIQPTKVLAAKHYLALFDSVDDIAACQPDFAALARLPLPAVIITAQGQGDFDFVSRFFAPANGVPEDSVSGVAHCCLAPFWSARLEKTKLVGRQLSARGGTVLCEHDDTRVILEGAAVVSLEGTLWL
ncbi:putative isomerase YddE [Falsiruegeria litorea R37]|uniref:Putative isomerase YddE n=1 Tax=Falsiruegeria litorea R37 TaxID=1200284 RepID=A0A1Y5TX93_9RHOB|nr:PhzF family phenazine biosynthesis protein [Falsiruegeria litorea]SLN72319.1 putative isomerase YddE [Falsiruegeria litorea R37]